MKTKLTFLLIIFSVCSFLLPVLAEISEHTINVSGTGTINSDPDTANLSFTVTTDGKTAAEASNKNATESQRLINTLTSSGIDKKDIQTSNFFIFPITKNDQFNSSDNKIVGYRVSNTISALLKNIDKAGSVIDSVTAAGDFTLNGISFGLADSSSSENEALKKAVADARNKAQVVAQAAGEKISGIKSITVGGASTFLKSSAPTAFADGASTEILPSDISVSASVNIEYIIGN